MPRPRTCIASLAIAVATVVLALPAAPAGAGGGCHEATEGEGDTVVLDDACFGPSVLHTEAGGTVRFVNQDPVEHNVYGAGWEIGELMPGESGHRTFAEEGLYAFQCTFHPGMSGTIVVGDGDGPGNGATVAVAAAQPPAPAPTGASSSGGSSLPAAAAGLLVGLAVGVGAMAASRRRRVATVPA
ncbi:MAG TPA: plastocyanin/azurin family copper-binding protein [Actinomycetota bacterium]|nr:plastocyanin/azurin family copper-binding protein [Actinomycetota bacterium]